jgi:MFS family permease
VRPIVADPRRWKALGVLGLIQFMLILDVTVVNVALPDIYKLDLKFGDDAALSWVVNGYVLMAGGLLLLGGRLADILGRRRDLHDRRRDSSPSPRPPVEPPSTPRC